MKWAMAAVIAALWIGYAAQKDRHPVPAWYHPAAHLLYAAMLLTVAIWL